MPMQQLRIFIFQIHLAKIKSFQIFFQHTHRYKTELMHFSVKKLETRMNNDTPKNFRFLPKFLDRYLDVPEEKVTYMTRVTPIDKFLAVTFLPLLPKKITPNQITKFRLISIPFILYFFLSGQILIGTILFLFSAFSDALDGALARTTHQISNWGTFYDPVADKLLVGLTA